MGTENGIVSQDITLFAGAACSHPSGFDSKGKMGQRERQRQSEACIPQGNIEEGRNSKEEERKEKRMKRQVERRNRSKVKVNIFLSKKVEVEEIRRSKLK